MIKLLIVDDSAVIRAIIKQFLANDKRFEIAGEAPNGKDAITKAKQIQPDLIIMDINMPVMNGIEATRIITKETNCAVVIFTTEDTVKAGFEALNAGAVEIIGKPDLSQSSTAFYENFKEKLYSIGSKSKKEKVITTELPVDIKTGDKYSCILIGASTGGPVAVQTVLKSLGRDIGVPVLVTQHIDVSFANHYTAWLSENTGMEVAFAKDGEKCIPGHVYVAPPDFHMVLTQDSTGSYCIGLNKEQEIHFLRPAVDPMFFSGAKVAGKKCIGILLTGMGRDGADGCVELKRKGAFTICEAEETCAVFGMPKAAIEENGATAILPSYKIGTYVRKLQGLN